MSNRYETKVVQLQALGNMFVDTKRMENFIQNYNNDGWRLVSTVMLGVSSVVFFIEREIKDVG